MRFMPSGTLSLVAMMLCACGSSEVEAHGRACGEGDFRACDRVVAHFELGVGVPEQRELATFERQRTLARRMTHCAKIARDTGKATGEACDALPASLRELAEAGDLPRGDLVPVFIDLELLNDGSIVFQGEKTSIVELTDRARKPCAGEVRVRVLADPNVTHRDLIRAIDRVGEAGCKKVLVGATAAAHRDLVDARIE